MLKAPIPSDEEQRYRDLLSYDILDSEEDEDYNQLTDLAAMLCDCEMATITFIDKHRQWFKAVKNMPHKEGSRDNSFCGHAIMHSDIMVINDASKDDRFHDNPDVAGGLSIGFYAGAPIISSAGYKLGTVCVIDHVPKQSFDPKQKQALEIIAAQVKKLLELRIKNKLIQRQSEEIIKAEKNIAKLNTLMREKQNNKIAYELHENIAQLVAAAKMNVEMTENENADAKESTDTLKNYLSIILEDVKSLSNSITPTTFTSADYTIYILQLGEQAEIYKNIDVRFTNFPKDLRLTGSLGLTIYRITQDMLNYALLAGADNVEIEINAHEKIQLIFKQNGDNDVLWSDDAKVLINNIITRADIINAQFISDRTHNKMELVFELKD
jgi:GAF domain-containing protein